MGMKVALFGEAERGEFSTLYHFNDICRVAEVLGEPPVDSRGIAMGVQALLTDQEILFLRVKEEGFSHRDYFLGLKLLKEAAVDFAAVCLPGVGDHMIITETTILCHHRKCLLITEERDFYDYLTA